jgi:hypothetical protein
LDEGRSRPAWTPSPLGSRELKSAVGALRRIFWGGLVCIIDVRTDLRMGERWVEFDWVPDLLGMSLILSGVVPLALLRVDPLYRRWMAAVVAVSALATLGEALAYLPMEESRGWTVFWKMVGLWSVVATWVFTLQMRRLSEVAKLGDAASSWRSTSAWFLWVYLVPLGAVNAAIFVTTATGTKLSWLPPGPGAHAILFLACALLLVPHFKLFGSTSTMARSAGAMAWRQRRRERPSAAGLRGRGGRA